MATQDLNAEKQAIQTDLDTLNAQIATLQGEIKAQLKALNVKEEDLESTYTTTLGQLQEKEKEFDELFASYEKLKLSLSQLPTQQGFNSLNYQQQSLQPQQVFSPQAAQFPNSQPLQG